MLVAHLRNARRPSDYQSDARTSVLVSINWSRMHEVLPLNDGTELADTIGFEPISLELTAPRSTIELHVKNKWSDASDSNRPLNAWKAHMLATDTSIAQIIPDC